MMFLGTFSPNLLAKWSWVGVTQTDVDWMPGGPVCSAGTVHYEPLNIPGRAACGVTCPERKAALIAHVMVSGFVSVPQLLRAPFQKAYTPAVSQHSCLELRAAMSDMSGSLSSGNPAS